MARNLVTGGMGLFGSYLARELLADGEEVILFQRRSKLPPSAADLEGKVEIHSGDITNWVQVLEVLKKYEEGLKDIEGFSHLHIFYWLHKAKTYTILYSSQ